ncbi:unnamed protein product [Pedinophyceae sp. YPF-701]|nr:unnamed protein product [Pedinophyceae sp. YPF-701]
MDDIEDDNTNYYAALNISRDARPAEVKAAYRRLSMACHPDKVTDPELKQQAAELFHQVVEAYEVLSNEEKRRIYDVYGVAGLKSGLEITTRDDTLDDIKREWERFRIEREEARLRRQVTSKSAFSLHVDATRTVRGAPVGGGTRRELPSIRALTMSSSASAPAGASGAITAGGSGAFRSDGAGRGNFSAGLKQQLTAHDSIELGATLGMRTMVTAASTRQLSPHDTATVLVTWEPPAESGGGLLAAMGVEDEPGWGSMGMAITSQRQLGGGYSGEARAVLGPVPALSVALGRGDEVQAWQARMDLGTMIGVSGAYVRTLSASTSMKLEGKLTLAGGSVDAVAEQRVTAATSAVLGVSVGTKGVTWKLGVKRGGHRLTIPIKFVGDDVAERVGDGVLCALLPPVVAAAGYFCFWRPFRDRVAAARRARARQAHAEEEAAAAAKVAAAAELLMPVTRRAIREELERPGGAGLVILEATYGAHAEAGEGEPGPGDDGEAGAAATVDVTVATQYMIRDGRLAIASGVKKRGLFGFADPAPYEDNKRLRVTYAYRGAFFEADVGDEEALDLPSAAHRMPPERTASAKLLLDLAVATAQAQMPVERADARSKCSWRLRADRPTALSLDSIDTELLFDEVTVRANGNVVGRFSGTHASAPLVVRGDVEVTFESDSDVQGSGFSMSYEPAETQPVTCGDGAPLSFHALAITTTIDVPAGETCEVTIIPPLSSVSGDILVAGARSVQLGDGDAVVLSGCGKLTADFDRAAVLRVVGTGDGVVLGAAFGEGRSALAMEEQHKCTRLTTVAHRPLAVGRNVQQNVTATLSPIVNPGGISVADISDIRAAIAGQDAMLISTRVIINYNAAPIAACSNEEEILLDGIAVTLFNLVNTTVAAAAKDTAISGQALLTRRRFGIVRCGDLQNGYTGDFRFLATPVLGAQLLTRVQLIVNGTIDLKAELARDPVVLEAHPNIASFGISVTSPTTSSVVGEHPIINPGGVSAGAILFGIRPLLIGAQGTQVIVPSISVGNVTSRWTCSQVSTLYDGLAVALFNFTDIDVVEVATLVSAPEIGPEGALLSRGPKPFSCARMRRSLQQIGNGTAEFTSYSFKATTFLGAQLLTRLQLIANGTVDLAAELARDPIVRAAIPDIASVQTNISTVTSVSFIGATAPPVTTQSPRPTTPPPTLIPNVDFVSQAQAAVNAELQVIGERAVCGGLASCGPEGNRVYRVRVQVTTSFSSALSCEDRDRLGNATARVLFNLGSQSVLDVYTAAGLLQGETLGECTRLRMLVDEREMQATFSYVSTFQYHLTDLETTNLFLRTSPPGVIWSLYSSGGSRFRSELARIFRFPRSASLSSLSGTTVGALELLTSIGAAPGPLGDVSVSTVSTIRSALTGGTGTRVTVPWVAFEKSFSSWDCPQVDAVYDALAVALFNFTEPSVAQAAAASVNGQTLLARGSKPFGCAEQANATAPPGVANFTGFSFLATDALATELAARITQIANSGLLFSEMSRSPTFRTSAFFSSSISLGISMSQPVTEAGIAGPTNPPSAGSTNNNPPVNNNPVTGTSPPQATTLAPTLPPKLATVEEARAEIERIRDVAAQGGTVRRAQASTSTTYDTQLTCAQREELRLALGQVLFNIATRAVVLEYLAAEILTLATSGPCARRSDRRALSETDAEITRRLQQGVEYTTDGSLVVADPAEAAALEASISSLGAGGGTALVQALQALGTVPPTSASATARVETVNAAQVVATGGTGAAGVAVASAALAAVAAGLALAF